MSESLSKKIRTIRQNLGLNKTEFGKLFGTTGSLVNKWENGQVIPSEERLKAIADLDGTSVRELLIPSSQLFDEHVLDKLDELMQYMLDDGVDENLASALYLDLKLRFFHPFADPIVNRFNSFKEIDNKIDEYYQEAYEKLSDPNKRYKYLLGQLSHKVYFAFEEYEAYFKKQSYESIKESDSYPWGTVEGAPIELLKKVQKLKKDTISKIDDISNEYDK